MMPDYDHFCKCPIWMLEEAVALSFAKDPERVTLRDIKSHAKFSPFARRYRLRWIQVDRALVPWARNNGIELPATLLATATNYGISLKNWQNRYEEAIEDFHKREMEYDKTIKECHEALDAARAEIAGLPCPVENGRAAESEEAPGTAVGRSMLKLIAALSIGGYGTIHGKSVPRRPEQSEKISSCSGSK